MLRIKPLVRQQKMRRVEPIRGPPKLTRLDAQPARHFDDRIAASPEQFERLPMLRWHLLVDQERHSLKLQRPQRADKLQQAFEQPVTEGHGVEAHQREGAIDLDRRRRAPVDYCVDLLAIAAEDEGIERHIDRQAIELLTLYIEAEFRSQLDRPGSAVGDGVLETGYEHGPADALDSRSDAWPDDFGRHANDTLSALMQYVKLLRFGCRRRQKASDAPPLEPDAWPEVQGLAVGVESGILWERLQQ